MEKIKRLIRDDSQSVWVRLAALEAYSFFHHNFVKIRSRSSAYWKEHSSAYSSSPVLGGKMSMFERKRVRHFSETSHLPVETIKG